MDKKEIIFYNEKCPETGYTKEECKKCEYKYCEMGDEL